MANFHLPKIKIGKSIQNRSAMDKSHDVNTSSGFGFMQPLMCLKCAPQSETIVKRNSEVRLLPMPVPTYGRLSLNTYDVFVREGDLYRPLDNLLERVPYNDGYNSYIPEKVPHTPLANLWFCLLTFSTNRISAYSWSGSQITMVNSTNKASVITQFTQVYHPDSASGSFDADPLTSRFVL